MSEHKIEDYKGQIVKVGSDSDDALKLELLGEFAGGGVIVLNEDGMMEQFDYWEPLPKFEPITVLDLMKGGMFTTIQDQIENMRPVFGGDHVRLIAGGDAFDRVTARTFHLDPTAPLCQWKPFTDLVWADLGVES